ncbi:unnamed protein product [Angiostrongylus costaricensis]|uniref:AMP-binding domain-containing protein n=1 Tax=Angiostrongylus costaricensis TaxID=334426 RepID=A0A0R3PZ29_ANGCS|nr:unnamed protein product [Angiostrongylus costaricensis]
MIISEFSIHEVLASGEDLHLSCHEVRRLALSLRQVFADATGGLVALRMERSARVICVLVTLLETRVPFIFLREDEDPVSVGAKWLFDGKNLTKLSYNRNEKAVDITEDNELCYFIRTSGTTGMEKLVGVPYSCIEPNIEDFRSKQIGIGTPLKCTLLSVTQDSELLIGGTRQCFISGVLSEEFTATGDVVEVIENEFFIIGRTDDQVKVNGTRCNLAELSTRVASLNGVTFAQFLLYKEKFLVLFVLSNSPLEASMRDIIPEAFIPSKVVYLDRVPVNSNGGYLSYAIFIFYTAVLSSALIPGKADRSQMVALLEKQCSKLMNSQSDMLLFLNKSLDKDVIVVCSHSGVVACIRAEDGYCIWEVNLSCRFEASPELCGQYIAVGGFDGNVYFLSVDTGYIEWRFATGDIVKASCAVDDASCAYVLSYDRNLYKLNPQCMAALFPTLFSFVKTFMHGFDKESFDREVCRDFDSQEITSAIARYEREASALLNDVGCVVGYFMHYIGNAPSFSLKMR